MIMMGRSKKASWIHSRWPHNKKILRLEMFPDWEDQRYEGNSTVYGITRDLESVWGSQLGFWLKSSVTRISSEPLSSHLENVTSNTYIIVWKFKRENSTKSRCDGSQEQVLRKSWLLVGSISFPEGRTHVESVFLKDDLQDDFQALRKIKNLLFCHIYLRKHAVGLVRTIQ